MRFIVENFGPIRKADVTLGNFTVFTGPGGTGKSYLAYLIWMLLNTNPDWETIFNGLFKIPISGLQEIKDKIKQEKMDLSEQILNKEESDKILSNLLYLVQEAHNKTILQDFKEVFRVNNVKDLIGRYGDKSHIEICNNKKTKKIAITITKNSVKFIGFRQLLENSDFSIRFDKEERKISFYHKNKEVVKETMREKEKFYEKLIDILIPSTPFIMAKTLDNFSTANNPFILTDSKSGFLRFSPGLIRYSLQSATPEEKFPMSKADRKMLSDLVIDEKEIKHKKIASIANFLEKEMEGKIDIKTVGLIFPEITLKKYRHAFPILRSHSGARELAPLILYLKYVLNKGDFIAIEEPETHLHPYMQSVVTRGLSLLSEYANVLVTTHSPIVLDELNCLIKLNRLPSKKKIKIGYKKYEGLPYRRLKIYRFKPDGIVEKVSIGMNGINEEEFSSVIIELSNKYAAVEEGLYRG